MSEANPYIPPEPYMDPRVFEKENDLSAPKRPWSEHPLSDPKYGVQAVCPITVKKDISDAYRRSVELKAAVEMGLWLARSGWRGERIHVVRVFPYMDISDQGRPGEENAVLEAWVGGSG